MATTAQRLTALETFRDDQQRPWNKATSDRIGALEARLAKLEGASTPTPPTPVPGPLVVTTKGAVIDGYTFKGTYGVGMAIIVKADDVTIRNCTIDKFSMGIWSEGDHCVIENNTIRDCDRGGIFTISQQGGRITGNLIQRIGEARTNFSGPLENNAYGIAITDEGGPVSSDILVEGNTVEDVTLWHGLDTHNGARITFRNNIVRRCARALFITKSRVSPRDCVVIGNQFLEAKTKPGGTNAGAVTLYIADGVTLTDNTSSKSYTQPMTYDYTGQSKRVTETGTVYVA